MADFRSDTVTQPTKQMREAFLTAKVGDDVYRDDPTTNELEQKAARLMGKEAALFVVSGVMGNQLAIMAHTNKGEEIICCEDSHIFENESGSAQMLSGVSVRTCKNDLNTVTYEDVNRLIRSGDIHKPKTSLVCVENATAKGNVVGISDMQVTFLTANSLGLKVHLDGARIFNAALYLSCQPSEIAKNCDSVMFCLSKGLCAPVGSILAGSHEFIEKCRRYRKMMGGGIRQSGIIASSGIIAIETMINRLKEDHKNAQYIARELETMYGVDCNSSFTHINMVFCRFNVKKFDVSKIFYDCSKNGIMITPIDKSGQARFVTNMSTNQASCQKLIEIIRGGLI